MVRHWGPHGTSRMGRRSGVVLGVALVVLVVALPTLPGSSDRSTAAAPGPGVSAAVAATSAPGSSSGAPATPAPTSPSCGDGSGPSTACSHSTPPNHPSSPDPPAASGWLTTEPPAATPQPLNGGAVTYDSSGQVTLLFGGSEGGRVTNATWEFVGGRWVNLTAELSTAPPPRVGATLADDPGAGGALLFGGTSGGRSLGDTWLFASGRWVNLTAPGGPSPSPRSGASLVYDPVDQEMVLFGGSAGSRAVNDTWAYTKDGWMNITQWPANGPSPRSNAAVTFDAYDNTVFLFGGSVNGAWLSDSWTFLSGTWTKVVPIRGSPPKLATPRLGFDSGYTAVELVGRLPIAPLSIEVWWYDGGLWTVGNATGLPETLSSTSALVDDPGASDLLLVDLAGVGACGGAAWRPNGTSWNAVPFPGGLEPCIGVGSSVVYDPAGGYDLLFGGVSVTGGNVTNETWKYQNGAWSRILPVGGVSPPSRAFASLTFDARDGYALLFGGSASAQCAAYGSGQSIPLRSDTWSFANGTWRNLTLSAGLAPEARCDAAIGFDARDSTVVLFGGNALYYVAQDTWEFSGGRWSEPSLKSPAVPPARAGAGLTYDPSVASLLLFGGSAWDWGNLRADPLGDTWLFSNGTWTLQHPGTPPPALSDPAVVFDPIRNASLLAGGWDLNSAHAPTWLGGTYAFDGKNWTTVNSSAGPVGGPLPTAFSGWVFNPHDNTSTLIGGVQANRTGEVSWSFGTLLALEGFTASARLLETRTPVDLVANVSGGSRFVNYSFSGLPAGCAAGAGLSVVCVPSTAGNYTVAFSASDPDSGSLATAAVSLDVLPHVTAGVTVGRSESLYVGRALNVSVAAALGRAPYSYDFTSLPLGCHPEDAPTLSCTPQAEGSYWLNVTVTDGLAVTFTASVLLTIHSLPSVSAVFTQRMEIDLGQLLTLHVVASGGSSALTYTYAGLPPGCASANESLLECTPSLPGFFPVEVRAEDAGGFSGSASTTVVVNPPLDLVDFWSVEPNVTLGGSTELIALAVNGTAPFNFAYHDLPPGCAAANASTLTCEPTGTGTFEPRVTVTDAAGASATATLQLGVYVTPPYSPPPSHPIRPVVPPANLSVGPSERTTVNVVEVAVIVLLVAAIAFNAYRERLRRPPRRRSTAQWLRAAFGIRPGSPPRGSAGPRRGTARPPGSPGRRAPPR